MRPRAAVPCAAAAVRPLRPRPATTRRRRRAIPVLILDGQNNHDWRRTTESLQQTLAATGRFAISVSTHAGKGPPARAWQAWRPDFAPFGWWSATTTARPGPRRCAGFVAFVERGGGAVMVHAANNPFPDWPEFNQMIGLGWRKPDYGDRITIDDATGALVRTPKGAGCGGGPRPLARVPDQGAAARPPDHAGPARRSGCTARTSCPTGSAGRPRDMTVLDSAFSAAERRRHRRARADDLGDPVREGPGGHHHAGPPVAGPGGQRRAGLRRFPDGVHPQRRVGGHPGGDHTRPAGFPDRQDIRAAAARGRPTRTAAAARWTRRCRDRCS